MKPQRPLRYIKTNYLRTLRLLDRNFEWKITGRWMLYSVLIGVAGALLLNRSLQGLVFQVSTSDPLTFGSVIVILAAIALMACWLPAWRASSIPPVEAIRRER